MKRAITSTNREGRAPASPHFALFFVLAGALAALLAGCAVGPNYQPPKMAVPSEFANATATNYTTNHTVALWWREFHDDELNQLIERAIASNHDLRIATANLLQARALRLGAKAGYFPVVTGQASYANEKFSRASLFGFNSPNRSEELYDLGFDSTWELDIFGHVRRGVESASDQVEATEASHRDVLISVLSEVALNYLELRGAQNELAVQRRNADNQNQTLKITQARLDAGGGTELDVARARAQLDNTLATIPLIESSLLHSVHRLGVLIGRPPETLGAELLQPAPIPALPAAIDLGRPEDLLRRRPDIRVAERNLAAATANVGVAVSSLFPRVNFIGNIALQGTSFSTLTGPASDSHTFGPSITWAALDLGHVRSAIKAAGAQADAQLALYEKTVLTSLEETENSLVDYGRDQARQDYLQQSVNDSRRAAELAHARYDSGAADFLSVLDAERVELEAEDQLAQTQTQTAVALVAIYKALGGGWEKPNQ
jgi:multidrug efflux system outer membrane protein